MLLNITPDHLDHYEYKLQNYVNSKFQLIQKMDVSSKFIYYADDQIIAKEIDTKNTTATKIRYP